MDELSISIVVRASMQGTDGVRSSYLAVSIEQWHHLLSESMKIQY